MAQTTVPALLQIATPANRPPAARGASEDAGGQEAFSSVLDKRLGTEKPTAPPPSHAPERASAAKNDNGSAKPARAENDASDQELPDEPSSSVVEPVSIEQVSQAARLLKDAAGLLAASEQTEATITQPEPATMDDPLQASLAGLPAALAALLAAGAVPTATPSPQGEAQAAPAPTAHQTAATLAGLLADAAYGPAKAELPTEEVAPGTDAMNQEATGTFAGALAEAAGRDAKSPVLPAVETETGFAARAADTGPLAGNPNAGDTSTTPNSAAALAWTAAPARSHQEDSAIRLTVSQPPGHPAWAEAVGSKVSWLVGQHESKAELVLTPPQLGRVEVTLSVSGDQTTAQFVAATPAAREALEQALPRLREVLAEAGINLSQSGVSTSDQHGAGNGQSRQDASRHAGTEHLPERTETTGRAWLRAGEGLVDTFA